MKKKENNTEYFIGVDITDIDTKRGYLVYAVFKKCGETLEVISTTHMRNDLKDRFYRAVNNEAEKYNAKIIKSK